MKREMQRGRWKGKMDRRRWRKVVKEMEKGRNGDE